MGEGAGRSQWSDVFIVGQSTKMHFYSVVPPRVMGGSVINQQYEQD